MPEADDHRAAELADAVRKRPQIAVVAASGDLRDRGQGGIPLQDRDRAVPAGRLRERGLERFPPAAVVPDQVRLLAGRLGKVRDRLVGTERPMLVNAQVRGLVRGQRRSVACRASGRYEATDHEDHGGSGDHGGH